MFLSTTQENKVFYVDGDRVPKAVACTERPLRIALCESQPFDGDLALPVRDRRLDSPGGIPLEVQL